MTEEQHGGHPTTREEAERIDIYHHLEWYCRVLPRIYGRQDADPVAHLEEIARSAVIVSRLDGWQGFNIHRAVLVGVPLPDIAEAFDEPPADVVRRWRRWSDGQRRLQTTWPEAPGFDAAEHNRVAATLAEQLPTA